MLSWRPGDPPIDFVARQHVCTTCAEPLPAKPPWVVIVYVKMWAGERVAAELQPMAHCPACSRDCAQAGCAYLLCEQAIPGLEVSCSIIEPTGCDGGLDHVCGPGCDP